MVGRPRVWVAGLIGLSVVLTGIFEIRRATEAGTLSRPPLSMSGKLLAVESEPGTLTLLTESGELQFSIADGSTVHAGAGTLEVRDLSSVIGQRIKVWYQDTAGQRVVRDVRITLEPTRAPEGAPSTVAR